MRFLLSGFGLNIALCGLVTPNLAVAAPLSLPTSIQSSSQQLTIARISTDGKTVAIEGNGVEFRAPAGFEGGSPSSEQTKEIVSATVKMFPSMASFAKMLDGDSGVLRALAVKTSNSDASVIIVAKLPFPEDISLARLQKVMGEALPSLLPPEFKLVDSRIVKVGGRQIVKMEIEANTESTKARELMGLFKIGNETYQLLYVFDGNNPKQARANFEGLIRTFKVTPTTPEQSSGF